MSERDEMVYLGHMLDMARKAQSFIADKTRTDFDTNEPLRLALLHLIQVIGEAARRVSPTTREQYPQIEWVNIIGMRSKIVHDYTHIEDQIIWETVINDLPALIKQLAAVVPDEPDDE